jgi:glutamine amidotransferase
MQALLDSSEENDGTPALGFIPGTVKKFSGNMHDDRTGDMLKIPHMGWNTVRQNVAHPLWRNIPDETRFYFVHSYYVAPQQPEVVAGITEYGEHFASAIFRDNVFAVQFHPEKSQHMGLQLLRNFLGWDGQS